VGFFVSSKLVLKDITTTNCRVKRHWMTNPTLKHGSPAEAEPDRTICTQLVKMGGHPSRPQTFFKSTENLSTDGGEKRLIHTYK